MKVRANKILSATVISVKMIVSHMINPNIDSIVPTFGIALLRILSKNARIRL